MKLIFSLQKKLKVYHEMITRLLMISMKGIIGEKLMIQGLKIKMMLQKWSQVSLKMKNIYNPQLLKSLKQIVEGNHYFY